MKRFITLFLVVLLLVVLLLIPAASAAETEYPYKTSDWAYEDVMRAKDINILNPYFFEFNDMSQPISRWDFAANSAYLVASSFGSNVDSYLLIMNYRGMAESNKYPLLYVTQVIEELGIIQGREDGDWDADSFITRQEAAVMLARTYRAYQDTMPDTMKPLSFTDQGDIADWALEDVRLMSHLGVMSGVGDGRFNPMGIYTKEQCVVSLLRLYENVPYDGAKQNPFAIQKRKGDFMKVWDESNQTYAFAIETEDYYICALQPERLASGIIGSSPYDIQIVDQDFSLRSYPTPILRSSSSRGDIHARPENPVLSEDGAKLFYTAIVNEDAYRFDFEGNRGQTPIFRKGIYTVTMDLKTGKQTYTRTDLK